MSGGERLREIVGKMTAGPWEFGREFGIHTKTRRPDQCGCPDNHHGYQAFCVIENDSGVYPPCVTDGEGIVTLRNCADELLAIVDCLRHALELGHLGEGGWAEQALRALDAKLERGG